MFVAFRFRYVNQLNTGSNIYATTVQSTENFLTYTSKWRKFFCFASASLSLSRLQDHETTSLQVDVAGASQTNDERQKAKVGREGSEL